MTPEDKRTFINSLCGSVRKEILSKVESMPEEWNGMELRQYIADKFADAVWLGVMKGKRLRDYKNAVIVNNL